MECPARSASRRSGFLASALVLLVLLLSASVFTRARAAEKRGHPSNSGATATPTNPSSPQAQSSSSPYAGAESCKTCHEEIYEGFEKGAHWKTMSDTRGGPSHQGCEGCHGPAAEHVNNPGDLTKIFSFKTASVKEINDHCLTCHASGPQQMHAINSLHTKNDVACTACHSPHHAQQAQFILAKKQPDLCYTCHLQQKPQFSMPFHHRVNEGLIQCTDCHNPHGSVLGKQVRQASAQDTVCFTCHTDKRGPFVFEHAPVKTEGCTSCHVTHGSPNAHLLKVSTVNLLCLSCHTVSFSPAPGAPSFHNQAAQYQACTMCHTQIHGSHIDPFFFK